MTRRRRAQQPARTTDPAEASRREEALKVDGYENAGPGSRPDYSKARIRIDRRPR